MGRRETQDASINFRDLFKPYWRYLAYRADPVHQAIVMEPTNAEGFRIAQVTSQ